MIAVVAALGAAEGLAVGAGLAALVVLLAIGVRLAAATGTPHWVRSFQWALTLGGMAGASTMVFVSPVHGTDALAVPLGLAMGLFTGLLAAGLAESAAALPVLGRRLGLVAFLPRLVVAVALGKLVGAVAWLLVPGLFARPPL